MGVYSRGDKLFVRFKDAEGRWRGKYTGYRVGQERLAHEMHAELVRLAAAPSAPAPIEPLAGGKLTVRAFLERWLRERRERGLDWKVDASRLKLHVLPFIGELPIADVRARHLVDMFHQLRTDSERDLAPRTIHHIYSVVAAMFRDAVLADLIDQSPAVLTERQLGPARDKDPEWRDTALLERAEVEQIISDLRIPPDRQVVYGLELLAGVRPGEAAALRWRHYDPTVTPLGKLLVARSYNTRRNAEKTTKTEAVKHVPVHPVLAAMLAEWKLGGWAEMMGRAPTPDDLIVPLPPEHAARRRTRSGEAFRPNDYSGKRWTEDDLPALGWRHRRHYDMRATFITLVLQDGADRDVIERYVTHTRRLRNAFDGYDRGLHWERTCAEVAKLRIARGSRREVAAVAAAGPDRPDPGDPADSLPSVTAVKTPSDSNRLHGSPSVALTVASDAPPRSTTEPSAIDRGVAPRERGPALTERRPALRLVTDAVTASTPDGERGVDLVADALMDALRLRHARATARDLRRVLRRIEELLDADVGGV